jgi:hypothetical protein
MRWEDERYIRIFTRDTPSWDALGWEAQALLVQIFRKMDRTGLLALGGSGRRGLAACVRIPLDVVDRALDVLLEEGVLSMLGPDIFCKNFMAAQECAKSDALRSKEKRERAHLRMTLGVSDVTREVAQTPRSDTRAPQGDTPSVPSVPCLPFSQPEIVSTRDPGTTEHQASPPNEHGKPTARSVLTRFGAIRAETCGGKATFWQPSQTAVDKAAAWLVDMPLDGVADIEPAIRLACVHVKDGSNGWADPKMMDPNFLFGSFVSRWSGLREELHGCAPKAAASSNGQPKRMQARY